MTPPPMPPPAVSAGAAFAAAAIIDMHLHALHADDQGPPPVRACAPYTRMPVRDARLGPEASFAAIFKTEPPCARPLTSAPTDDALRERIAQLEERLARVKRRRQSD